MNLTYRRTCRSCGSPALKKVIDLGEQHIQGVFAKPGEELPPMRKVPLALMRCDPTQDEKACGLLQTSVSVPPDILYFRYWYRSGTNQTMTDHLRGIADEVVQVIDKPRGMVLDIGSNDGTLLHCYPSGYQRYGIDPSDAVLATGPGITVIRETFPSPALAGLHFDAVTAVAMFYDLEDPVAFARSVRDVLAPNGIFVFEQSYMPLMLSNRSYDTICHEHLEYYSLATIERVLRAADLKVIRMELNDSNGGSIRCFATHASSTAYHRLYQDDIDRRRRLEFDLALDTDAPYANFQDQVNHHRDDLQHLVWGIKREHKSIHVYGASTKGNTILQFCGLTSTHIDYAADRNPDKHGARTIGSDIAIISEAESRAMRPDYYLVLPWHFRREFVEREEETLRNGTKLIFPLPRIEVVEAALVPV